MVMPIVVGILGIVAVVVVMRVAVIIVAVVVVMRVAVTIVAVVVVMRVAVTIVAVVVVMRVASPSSLFVIGAFGLFLPLLPLLLQLLFRRVQTVKPVVDAAGEMVLLLMRGESEGHGAFQIVVCER